MAPILASLLVLLISPAHVFKPESKSELKYAVVACLKSSTIGNCYKGPHTEMPLGYDTKHVFRSAQAFTHDISQWDVSKVTDMKEMFYNAKAFNHDISAWDVSNVANMVRMFHSALAFNQDISGWNVSKVISMQFMFYNAQNFNQDISGWSISAYTNVDFMFCDAISFNQTLCGKAWVTRQDNKNLMFYNSPGWIASKACTITTPSMAIAITESLPSTSTRFKTGLPSIQTAMATTTVPATISTTATMSTVIPITSTASATNVTARIIAKTTTSATTTTASNNSTSTTSIAETATTTTKITTASTSTLTTMATITGTKITTTISTTINTTSTKTSTTVTSTTTKATSTTMATTAKKITTTMATPIAMMITTNTTTPTTTTMMTATINAATTTLSTALVTTTIDITSTTTSKVINTTNTTSTTMTSTGIISTTAAIATITTVNVSATTTSIPSIILGKSLLQTHSLVAVVTACVIGAVMLIALVVIAATSCSSSKGDEIEMASFQNVIAESPRRRPLQHQKFAPVVTQECRTLANSNYKWCYAQAKAPVFQHGLLHAVHSTLELYAARSNPALAPNELKMMVNNCMTQIQEDAFRHTKELTEDVAVVAEYLWTSCNKYMVFKDMELSMVLNTVIRDDIQTEVLAVAPFIRSLNLRRVHRKLVKPQCYPPKGQTWRGGGFRNQYKTFFDCMIGSKYRVPAFLATSVKKAVAMGFAKVADKDHARVLWCIRFDPRGKSDPNYRVRHMTFVNKTLIPGEGEYLFAPYSVFTLVSVAWSATQEQPHNITILAANDNKEEDENLDLVPWY